MMKPQLPQFEQARVLVVGDLMLDRYWHGDTSRISPEAPVPVVRVGQSEERAGGAGNVALNIASLGGGVALHGLTGDDEACASLETILTANGVSCHLTRLPGLATITKLRVLSRHQQLIRLDFEDGFEPQHSDKLLGRYTDSLAQCDIVVLSDYGKGTLGSMQALIQQAREAGKPVIVDPKGHDFGKYRGASVITPNMSEFEGVVGPCRTDEELVQKGQRLIQELALEALLITRSERGMTLLQKEKAAIHLPTHAREVFDVTGAGDTVVSVLAAALAAGDNLAEATALSNIAAGIVVSKLGTATVSVAEIRRAIREQHELPRGVMEEDELLRQINEAKEHGETIVMTNGCFDILHAGHVTYLEQARELGDRLVVAVNDDKSVQRLKGADRPVNSLDKRMRMLAALECVDWVVPFYDDTPTKLICKLLPQLLVKGGDTDPDNIPGSQCVRDAGGEVRLLGYEEGLSTTGIIGAIRESEQKTNKPDQG
ncbi:MAG: bifunctional D-glycero-beta-D-manno-heptose-7-phosphate kinase/D-glycero-beta-D-manno-heptose 1-phosphate adenylyltransferase HldE [Thiohalophilus sp.]|nr:bifunctional D-glycero-beta-D-manno-heptose-7-phosphate kinase/D-glycero-beta-D-manno-heptose 1-phosphate adenylyltransferase HldE [Thiohalophilus sp.]MDZ7661027.1 bifunctional D-glycero-beta-D-manno-heptose-7-phosphate kinase/D-glycero-beta-D-manno-heptose 1-phosphate adenylyltransferase HldE [Thiohalophilus sp.]